jgi:fatty acid desaturase
MENKLQAESIEKLAVLRLWRFNISLLGDWLGVIAGFSLFLYKPSILSFLLASIVLGIAQHALALLGHEAVHYRVSKNLFLNEWIGRLFCFFPVGVTLSTYRDFHFPHHRGPNSKNDPEVPLRRALGKNWAPPYTTARGIRLWVLSFLGLSARELAIFLWILPKGDLKERFGMTAYWMVVVCVAYHCHALGCIGLWFFSLATTYFSMLRFQGWYEHSLENSQSTNRYAIPSPIFRLVVPHNIWVHYEHHKYPMIPFYNLEKVRLLDSADKVYSFDEMVTALRWNHRISETSGTSQRRAG